MVNYFKRTTTLVCLLTILLSFVFSNPIPTGTLDSHNEEEQNFLNNFNQDIPILVTKRIDSILRELNNLKSLQKLFELENRRQLDVLSENINNNDGILFSKRNSFNHKHSSAIGSILSKIKNNG